MIAENIVERSAKAIEGIIAIKIFNIALMSTAESLPELWNLYTLYTAVRNAGTIFREIFDVCVQDTHKKYTYFI